MCLLIDDGYNVTMAKLIKFAITSNLIIDWFVRITHARVCGGEIGLRLRHFFYFSILHGCSINNEKILLPHIYLYFTLCPVSFFYFGEVHTYIRYIHPYQIKKELFRNLTNCF